MGQWDSFDYLKQIVTHQFSDLGIGRPVFIGYNIILWEFVSKVFRLSALEVESVVVIEIVLLGGAGVSLFDCWRAGSCPFEGASGDRGPASFAGLCALLGLRDDRGPDARDGHRRRGRSLGSRAGPACWARGARRTAFWNIRWDSRIGRDPGRRFPVDTLVRRFDFSSWVPSSLRFGVASVLVIVAPVALFYLYDPSRFMQRTRVWLSILPTGEVHFWKTSRQA